MPGLDFYSSSGEIQISVNGSTSDSNIIEGTPNNDTLVVAGGPLTIHGGAGDDVITLGGSGFVNGNQGDDTLVTGSHDGETVHGGQGNDSLDNHESSGPGILNGDLGDDTLRAGSGGDVLHGGQGADSLVAGSGGDTISGDLGDDTLRGGNGGHDLFLFGANSGHDVIINFDPGVERISLGGQAYTLSYSGDDTLITIDANDTVLVQGRHLTGTGWLV